MEFDQTPEDLQRKLYFLLDQLQIMAMELPPKYQMRVPTELLSMLANSLLNDTIFEIVKGLMEIQHVTEKHIFQQRLQTSNKHRLEIQDMITKVPSGEEQTKQKLAMQRKHREEMKHTDMKLVMQLDQKVSDQQVTLEKAGVPGFFVTNKPIEIKLNAIPEIPHLVPCTSSEILKPVSGLKHRKFNNKRGITTKSIAFLKLTAS